MTKKYKTVMDILKPQDLLNLNKIQNKAVITLL